MLWNGRFSQEPDAAAWALNASLPVDRRLALQDVRGSLAWAESLGRIGVLTEEEARRIVAGLREIAAELEQGTFPFADLDEDIHTAIERRLGERIGSIAGKLHTGRSRNDQVVTDFRLWMLEALSKLDEALRALQSVLIRLAEEHVETLMPGYTHLQRAQPVTLAHWLLSHFWPLERDRDRLRDLRDRVAVLPLGSGALAGTAFPIDRAFLTRALGFDTPAPNSMDAVTDRDFAAEFLFCTAMIGVHLSRLSEQMVLFTTTEFAFFELSDAFSTGSSLMPQKKNPDLFELARGKAGALIGLLTGLLATLKGLPSTYDKDLQEDKTPVFQAFDVLMLILPALTGALATMTVHPERMRAAVDPTMLAADLADYLVRKGVPFREAHRIVGRLVRLAAERGLGLDQLPLAEMQAEGPFDADALAVFDPLEAVKRRNVLGGTAPEAVREQIRNAKFRVQSAEG